MTKDLTVGKPDKVLLGFTLPMLASVVFQQLYRQGQSENQFYNAITAALSTLRLGGEDRG